MALIDELNMITEENAKREAQMLSEDVVYSLILKKFYEEKIIKPIKSEVSKGNYIIEGTFNLSGGSIDLSPEMSGRVKTTEVYEYSSGYDGPDAVHFKRLYILEENFPSKKRISLTPLGKRVYNDLVELAKNDGVVLSQPIAEYYCDYKTVFDIEKTQVLHPPLGEWFIGKNPDHWHRTKGASVNVKYSYQYKI